MKVFLLLIGVVQMVVGCSGDGEGFLPGMCSPQPQNFEPCNVDRQTCMGPVACRSCNSALRLWALEPAWGCGCGTNTVGGRTGLYWQCAIGPPVCTPGPDTFTDSRCTKTAADAGSR